MGKPLKLLFMAGCLFTVLYGIVKIKEQLGPGENPTLAIPSEDRDALSTAPARVTQRPTILEVNNDQQTRALPPYGIRAMTPRPEPSGAPEMTAPIVPAVPSGSPGRPYETLRVPSRGAVQPIELPSAGSVQSINLEATGAAPPIQLPSESPPAAELALARPLNTFTSSSRADAQANAWPVESDESTQRWVTKPGDSLWDVSVARYGTGGYYHALFMLNRHLIDRPDRLPAGLTLQTPSAETLRTQYPRLCP